MIKEYYSLTGKTGKQMVNKANYNTDEFNSDFVINYWIESSDRDYLTMKNMYEKKDYHWTLFIGHLVIEKLLKAYYVKKNNNHAPLIHNLLKLAKDSGIDPDENKKIFLATVTAFNLNARYDDYKLDFYKKCTKKYTDEWMAKIEENRKWIIKLLEI
jgi:HEPN domain-containing protein